MFFNPPHCNLMSHVPAAFSTAMEIAAIVPLRRMDNTITKVPIGILMTIKERILLAESRDMTTRDRVQQTDTNNLPNRKQKNITRVDRLKR